jgi:phage terminase large subunit GpA-like protein
MNLAHQTAPVSLPYAFRFTPGEARVFRPRERITVSQWAERHAVVTKGPMRGRWSNATTPYLVEPMDAWNLPHVREIYLCFAPQTGKTMVAFNCLSYAIDQDPGAAMYVMPIEETAKRIAKRRILPMLRNTPRLSAALSARSEDTTSMSVSFINGMDLMMTWATSSATLASEDVRYLVLDETDKYPEYSGTEADPISLARVRTNTYPHTKKILAISTPGMEPSTIWHMIGTEADEVRDYHVPCPICGHFQIMDWDHITWPRSVGDPKTITREKLAHYSCDKCGMLWDDYTRNIAVSLGRWIARAPIVRPTSIGFHLPSWYSPFISLSAVVADYLTSLRDPAKKMAFVTQHKAEEYKETVQEKDEAGVLSRKTALPSMVVPAPALVLTAGIDSHKWGYRFVVRAWEEDLTSHKIHHGHLATLGAVETLIFATRYQVEGSNHTMGLLRAAIDTGGGEGHDPDYTLTEEVYEWLRSLRTKYPDRADIVTGIKGASHRQAQKIRLTNIDKFPKSNKPIPGGLQVRLIDTAAFKALIHARMERGKDETQRWYLDADTGVDYAKEITAEELVQLRNGRKLWRRRGPNHYLDCEVYAAACADSEWLPSIKMLAPILKEHRDKTRSISLAQPAVIRQGAANPQAQSAAAAQAPSERSTSREFNRPAWLER